MNRSKEKDIVETVVEEMTVVTPLPPPPPPQPLPPSLPLPLSPEKALIFELDCKHFNNETCRQIHHTLFPRIAQRITLSLIIYQPILILVSFESYQQNNKSGATEAGCKIGNWIDDGRFSFPSALMKQRNPSFLAGGSSKFDMEITLNSDYSHRFWIYSPENDYMHHVDIRRDQVDLEIILLHEITHGLGFYDRFFTMRFSQSIKEDMIVLPKINHDGWVKNSIFDSFLWSRGRDGGKRLVDLSDMIRNAVPTICDLHGLVRSPAAVNAMRQLYQVCTYGPEAIIFRIRTDFADHEKEADDEILMHTTLDEFTVGSSLSHLSMDYELYEDFLMVPSGVQGTSLNQILEILYPGKDQRPVYGNKTLKILEAIGWRIQ